MFGFLVEALFPHVSTIAIGGTSHLQQICQGDIFISILQQACLYSLWMGIRLPLPGQFQIGGPGLLVRDGRRARGIA